MTITIEDGLADALYEPGAKPGFSVHADVRLRDEVVGALGAAIRRIVAEVPHPDAPDDGPYASYASTVAEDPVGCFSFWLDLADVEAFREDGVIEQIVEILVEELEAAGADPCTVGPFAAVLPPAPRELLQVVVAERYRFDGILPAGLPTALVDAFSDPAFGLTRPDGQHVEAEAWAIELRVDGTTQAIASMADALERNGFTVTSIRPRHLAYRGFGQRGEIVVHGSAGAVLTGQEDEPHPELAEIDHPDGAQPVLARRLSNPTRVEMSLWCPGSPAATLAHYERRLRLQGYELGQDDEESEAPGGQLHLQRPDSTVSVMAQGLPDGSSYGWVIFRRTSWPDY